MGEFWRSKYNKAQMKESYSSGSWNSGACPVNLQRIVVWQGQAHQLDPLHINDKVPRVLFHYMSRGPEGLLPLNDQRYVD